MMPDFERDGPFRRLGNQLDLLILRTLQARGALRPLEFVASGDFPIDP